MEYVLWSPCDYFNVILIAHEGSIVSIILRVFPTGGGLGNTLTLAKNLLIPHLEKSTHKNFSPPHNIKTSVL